MDFINPPNLLLDNKINTKQAMSYQHDWAKLIKSDDINKDIKTIAGIDIAYDNATNQAFAVAVLLDAHSLALVEVQKISSEITVPYRSGFLSFREVPILCKALDQLSQKPDLIVCDGQGRAHPRRFGLACHLGLIYDIPTLGCGKSRLFGTADYLGENRGDLSYLYDKNREIIGAVLRTRDKVKPVYVSIGHRISLKTACDWVFKLAPKYRLPETTRLADSLAHTYKINNLLY